jgi:hypothetical protein
VPHGRLALAAGLFAADVRVEHADAGVDGVVARTLIGRQVAARCIGSVKHGLAFGHQCGALVEHRRVPRSRHFGVPSACGAGRISAANAKAPARSGEGLSMGPR